MRVDITINRARSPRGDARADESGASPQRSRRFIPLAAAAVLVAAVLLRLAPLAQEFWYDEIVSLRIAFQAPGAANIFFPPRLLDTPLNQIVLRTIGGAAPAWCYRLPSLLAGTASLLLLYLLARGSGRRVSATAVFLAAFSYMMIHYCSEARGYALSMSMALAAFLALERVGEHADNGYGPPFLFWSATVLGFLSHPAFGLFYAGALAYSIAAVLSAGESEARPAPHAKAHGPVLIFLCFYAVWFQGQKLGDPLPFDFAAVVLDAVDFSFGVPGAVPAWWKLVPLALLVLVVGAGVSRDWIDGRRPRCVFLAAAAAVAVGIFAIGERGAFFPRYLIVLLPFALLEAAAGLVELCDRGAAGRLAAAAFLLLFLAGNGYHIVRFLDDGRGRARAALADMAARTDGDTVLVGADNDGRMEALMWFWTPAIERSAGKRFRLVSRIEYVAGTDPDWIVLHAPERAAQFPPEVRKEGRPPYGRVALYPHYGLSGFSLAVYKKGAPPG